MSEDQPDAAAGVTPAFYEQWSPHGCRWAAAMFLAKPSCDVYDVETARQLNERAALLDPVVKAYGLDGLLLVQRLAEGNPGRVSADLVVVALGILETPRGPIGNP